MLLVMSNNTYRFLVVNAVEMDSYIFEDYSSAYDLALSLARTGLFKSCYQIYCLNPSNDDILFNVGTVDCCNYDDK